MVSIRRYLFLSLLAACTALPAYSASREDDRLADASDVVDQLLRIPEKAIPPSLLGRAYGIAVIPDVLKAGFVVGARYGKGVLVIRQEDDTWSNPVFIKLTGGSVGWQAGAQSTDIILVFKTRRGVEGITDGKLTLGADASVAAGPVGRHTEVATDLKLEAEVYSYSRSRGLFAGIALSGAGITIDDKANAAYYGSPSITAEQVLASDGSRAPASANAFVQLLTAQTRRLPTQPAMASGDGARPATEGMPERTPEPKPKVRTFGVQGPDDPEEEEQEVAREEVWED